MNEPVTKAEKLHIWLLAVIGIIIAIADTIFTSWGQLYNIGEGNPVVIFFINQIGLFPGIILAGVLAIPIMLFIPYAYQRIENHRIRAYSLYLFNLALIYRAFIVGFWLAHISCLAGTLT